MNPRNIAPAISLHRGRLCITERLSMTVQRELREHRAASPCLIYDQTCASEKRRRRKRGTFPDPAKRFVINDRVCEGCGDCGVASNCTSIQPLETDFGRKRQIDQSSCNKDYSCVEGFCPSFVGVEGGQLKSSRTTRIGVRTQSLPTDIPLPSIAALPEGRSFNVLDHGRGWHRHCDHWCPAGHGGAHRRHSGERCRSAGICSKGRIGRHPHPPRSAARRYSRAAHQQRGHRHPTRLRHAGDRP